MNHAEWKTRRTRRLLGEEAEEAQEAQEAVAYVEAGHAFALGQAVFDRRSALGLSQSELARRARMTQPQVSGVEGGGSVPTPALLTRLAEALDAALTIDLDGDTSAFLFTGHEQPPRGGRTSAA